MMRGIDTNVLVRYIVRDDKRQAETASAYIHKITGAGEQCFINAVVLCEFVWVLDSAYGFEKSEIADVCDKILRTKQFEVESRDIVRYAVTSYRNGKADFADYLIGRTNHLKGCDMTVTFDRFLKDQEDFTLLQ